MKKTVASLNPSQAEDTFAQLSEVQDPTPPVSSQAGLFKKLIGFGTSLSRLAVLRVYREAWVCRSRTISHFLSLHRRRSKHRQQCIGNKLRERGLPDAESPVSLGQCEDLIGDKPLDRIYCIEVIEYLYEDQVADVLSLFYKLANPGAQLLITTPNYRSAWPLIEWLLDRFGLIATLDEVQHVAHFTKKNCPRCANAPGGECVTSAPSMDSRHFSPRFLAASRSV
jgi:hypothetical protein